MEMSTFTAKSKFTFILVCKTLLKQSSQFMLVNWRKICQYFRSMLDHFQLMLHRKETQQWESQRCLCGSIEQEKDEFMITMKVQRKKTSISKCWMISNWFLRSKKRELKSSLLSTWKSSMIKMNLRKNRKCCQEIVR